MHARCERRRLTRGTQRRVHGGIRCLSTFRDLSCIIYEADTKEDGQRNRYRALVQGYTAARVTELTSNLGVIPLALRGLSLFFLMQDTFSGKTEKWKIWG